MNKKRKTVLFSILLAGTAILTAVTVVGKGSVLETPAEGCEHKGTVNHHERVEPTLLKSGVKEYWCCCDCHQSFEDAACTKLIENTTTDPTDPSDGRYLAPIGVVPTESYIISGTLSSEDIPFPFTDAFDYESTNMQSVMKSSYFICGYERVAFCVKSTEWFYLFSDTDYSLAPNVWNIVELIQTAPGTWTLNAQNIENPIIERKSGLIGLTLKELVGLWSENKPFTMTNLRGTVKGEVIDESALSSNNVSITKVESDIPQGFKSVYKATADCSTTDFDKYFSSVQLRSYSEVYFMCNAHGWFLFSGWSKYIDADEWVDVTISNKGFGLYDITFVTQKTKITGNDGSKVLVKENIDSTEVITNCTKDALNTIFTKGGVSFESGRDIYVTELRAVRKGIKGSLIDESALSANGVSTTKVEMDAPGGYTSVYKATDDCGTKAFDKYFSAVDLRSYSEVYFMCNAHGYFLFSGWSKYIDADEWVDVTITNKGSGLFDVTFSTYLRKIEGNGDSKVLVKENIDSTDIVADCTVGALNTIFSKGDVAFQSGKEIYVTELRGVLAK